MYVLFSLLSQFFPQVILQIAFLNFQNFIGNYAFWRWLLVLVVGDFRFCHRNHPWVSLIPNQNAIICPPDCTTGGRVYSEHTDTQTDTL